MGARENGGEDMTIIEMGVPTIQVIFWAILVFNLGFLAGVIFRGRR